MTMDSRTRTYFTLLYFVGLALLIPGLYYLLPHGMRNAFGWLDITVICLVYSLNFPLAALSWARASAFELNAPALSIRWACTGTYTVLALGGALFMALQAVPFRYQVFYQVVLVFGVAFALGLSLWATSHTMTVAAGETALKSSLQNLRAAFGGVDDAFALDPDLTREREVMRRLREDARYLSPSSRDREHGLEQDLITELNGIRVALAASEKAIAQPELEKRIARCQSLMSMRKQPNIRQGEPS